MTKTCLDAIYRDFIAANLKFIMRKNLIFFLFLLKTDHGYTIELPRPGGTNIYPQSMFCIKTKIVPPVLLFKSGIFGVIHFTDMLT